MTNKLPEVGKSYISKEDYGSGREVIEIEDVSGGRVYPKGYSSIALKTFFDHYEELPEQPTCKESLEENDD